MIVLDQVVDCSRCPAQSRVRELEQQLAISRLVNDDLRRQREHLLLSMPPWAGAIAERGEQGV